MRRLAPHEAIQSACPAPVSLCHTAGMDIVRVGGWEHECCGGPVERGDVVDWTCFRDDGGTLRETHHGDEDDTVRVRGAVTHIELVLADHDVKTVERIPSGRALRGFDEHDDGHVQTADGTVVAAEDAVWFLVTVE